MIPFLALPLAVPGQPFHQVVFRAQESGADHHQASGGAQVRTQSEGVVDSTQHVHPGQLQTGCEGVLTTQSDAEHGDAAHGGPERGHRAGLAPGQPDHGVHVEELPATKRSHAKDPAVVERARELRDHGRHLVRGLVRERVKRLIVFGEARTTIRRRAFSRLIVFGPAPS